MKSLFFHRENKSLPLASPGARPVGAVACLSYRDGDGQQVFPSKLKQMCTIQTQKLTEDKSGFHFLRRSSPYLSLKNVTYSILSFINCSYVLFCEKYLFYFKINIHLQLGKVNTDKRKKKKNFKITCDFSTQKNLT